MDDNVSIVGCSISVPHIGPFLYGCRYEPNGAAAETVGAPSVEVHEVAAFCVVGTHVSSLEAPGRTQAVGHVPACAELTAAVQPTAVQQDTLTH